MHGSPPAVELWCFYYGTYWHKGMVELVYTRLLVERSSCTVAGCLMKGLAIACMQDIDGKDTQLNKYQGKVVLVVNLASTCVHMGGEVNRSLQCPRPCSVAVPCQSTSLHCSPCPHHSNYLHAVQAATLVVRHSSKLMFLSLVQVPVASPPSTQSCRACTASTAARAWWCWASPATR